MAEFNKSPNLPQASPYTSASQGTSPQRGSDAFGNLFKDLGKLGTGLVEAVDERNKSKINDELTTGIDAIRGGQGVDAAVSDAQTTQLIPDTSNTPNGGGPKTPPAIDSATSDIARLNAAYKEGKIGDSQYWAKTEALVRQVRARYPGYREEIDKKVSSITGTTPANALRRSLLEDLEKATQKKSSEADKFDTFVKGNLDSVSPETRKRWAAGERGSTFQAQVYDEVGTNKVNDAGVSRERARLGLAKEQGNLQQDDALGVATSEVNQHVNKTINAGVSAAGGTGLMNKIQSIVASGKAPTPEEITVIRSQFALLKANVSTGIDNILTNPLRQGSSDSYSSIIRDPTKLKQTKEMAMSRISEMETLLTNGEFGLFAINANASKAMEQSDTRKLLESSDFLRKLNAAKEILGKEGMGVWLNAQKGMSGLSAVSDAINDLNLAENVTGQGDAVAQLKRMKDQAIKDPAVYRNHLAKNSGVMGDAKTPVDAVINMGKSFYTSGDNSFINNFQEGQRGKVFAQLTTPEITANMVKAKSVNPQSWDQYKTWANNNFYSINKQTIDTLASAPLAEIGASVVLEENGRLKVIDSRPSGWNGAPGGFRDQMPGDGMIRGTRIANAKTQVDQFNRGLDSLEPIYKADGLKVKDALDVVYRQMGLSNPAEDKKPGNVEGSANTGLPFDKPEISDLIQIADKDSLIDLDAQEVRRYRTIPRGVSMDKAWGGSIADTADLRTGIRAAAAELGTTPEDLATVISYETGGTFDPSIRGGAGNRHIGLIQFGPTEQNMYGASQKQSAGEQLKAVVRYLKHRGYQPGMSILDLYSTINAGSPGLYGRSDANNGGAPGTVRDKVEQQFGRHRRNATTLLAD